MGVDRDSAVGGRLTAGSAPLRLPPADTFRELVLQRVDDRRRARVGGRRDRAGQPADCAGAGAQPVDAAAAGRRGAALLRRHVGRGDRAGAGLLRGNREEHRPMPCPARGSPRPTSGRCRDGPRPARRPRPGRPRLHEPGPRVGRGPHGPAAPGGRRRCCCRRGARSGRGPQLDAREQPEAGLAAVPGATGGGPADRADVGGPAQRCGRHGPAAVPAPAGVPLAAAPGRRLHERRLRRNRSRRRLRLHLRRQPRGPQWLSRHRHRQPEPATAVGWRPPTPTS
jgi:hypothetical protein